MYLYLLSFIGILVCVVAMVNLVDLGIKSTIFKNADKYEYYDPGIKENGYDVEQARRIADTEQMRSRQRTASISVAMLVVGLPLYLYHWGTIQKEFRKSKAESKA